MIRKRSSSGCRLPRRRHVGRKSFAMREFVTGSRTHPGIGIRGCVISRSGVNKSRPRQWLRVECQLMCAVFEGLRCLPAKVPLPVTRKARNGKVRPLNAGYLRDAAVTPSTPMARPAAPPSTPPFTVALRKVRIDVTVLTSCGKHTCSAPALLPWSGSSSLWYIG